MRAFKNGDVVRVIVGNTYAKHVWYNNYSFHHPQNGGCDGHARDIHPCDVAIVIEENASLDAVGIRNFEGYYRNHLTKYLEHVDVQAG